MSKKVEEELETSEEKLEQYDKWIELKKNQVEDRK